MITGVTEASGCYACMVNAQAATAPIRERILVTDGWRAAHAFGTSVPGWLVLLPTVHIETLADLSPQAAAELGVLLKSLTVAVREVTGCVKTYVALFAESEGFSHLHFHVIPRMVDPPEHLLGPRVFSALQSNPGRAVSPAEMDDLARRLRGQLANGAASDGLRCLPNR